MCQASPLDGLVEDSAGTAWFMDVPSPGTCVAAKCSWQHQHHLASRELGPVVFGCGCAVQWVGFLCFI